jgi:hypothetical protein
MPRVKHHSDWTDLINRLTQDVPMIASSTIVDAEPSATTSLVNVEQREPLNRAEILVASYDLAKAMLWYTAHFRDGVVSEQGETIIDDGELPADYMAKLKTILGDDYRPDIHLLAEIRQMSPLVADGVFDLCQATLRIYGLRSENAEATAPFYPESPFYDSSFGMVQGRMPNMREIANIDLPPSVLETVFNTVGQEEQHYEPAPEPDRELLFPTV